MVGLRGRARAALLAVGMIAALLARTALAATVIVQGHGPMVEGSGNVIEEERSVGAFTRVVLAGPVDVRLKRADAERAIVRADDNIVPLIETRVEGGQLFVEMRKDASFRTRNKLSVVVEFRQLDGVQVRGSGDLLADDVKAAIFESTINGSGNVRINRLEADTVAVSVSGSGNFNARGRAARLGVLIEGSGDVHAENLEAKTAAVSVRGSGDARVYATETLQARISGSGDIRYRGAPHVEKKVGGSGEVRPLR